MSAAFVLMITDGQDTQKRTEDLQQAGYAIAACVPLQRSAGTRSIGAVALVAAVVRTMAAGRLSCGCQAAQAARRRTSQTVTAMSSTDSASSHPLSIHWNAQNRLAGWLAGSWSIACSRAG
jgi:hypothetical protein